MTESTSAPSPGQGNDVMPGGGLTPSHYERLLAASRTLAAVPRLDDLLARLVQVAADLVDAGAASVLFTGEEEGTLILEAALAPGSLSMEAASVPVEASFAGWVVEQGEPLLVDDVPGNPRWSGRGDEETPVDVRTVLAVPLWTGERVTGCLEVFNRRGDAPFTEVDRAMLVALAVQVRVLIENARRRAQDRLVPEMIHELRTPLAAIKATMLVILRPEVPEDRRKQMVATVQQETDRLARMATDFVALARLESGYTRIRRGPVDVGMIIREAANIVAPQAEARGVEVSVDLPDALPAAAGDIEGVRQVVLKLLENAIKYNEAGGHVHVRAEQRAGMLRVEVEDDGTGIDERSLPFVFDRFFRGQAAEGETPGSGLGLSIARCIVERLGGEIGVESEFGAGSTFWFSLPLIRQP
jgi:signal transduction histidine kinase